MVEDDMVEVSEGGSLVVSRRKRSGELHFAEGAPVMD